MGRKMKKRGFINLVNSFWKIYVLCGKNTKKIINVFIKCKLYLHKKILFLTSGYISGEKI